MEPGTYLLLEGGLARLYGIFHLREVKLDIIISIGGRLLLFGPRLDHVHNVNFVVDLARVDLLALVDVDVNLNKDLLV